MHKVQLVYSELRKIAKYRAQLGTVSSYVYSRISILLYTYFTLPFVPFPPCRCNDMEDRMLENEKRAADLSRQKMALTQKVQQLTKLLANSKSSLKAVGNKVRHPHSPAVT